MRKLALLLVLILALLFSACGGKKINPPPAEEPAPPASSGEEVTGKNFIEKAEEFNKTEDGERREELERKLEDLLKHFN